MQLNINMQDDGTKVLYSLHIIKPQCKVNGDTGQRPAVNGYSFSEACSIERPLQQSRACELGIQAVVLMFSVKP